VSRYDQSIHLNCQLSLWRSSKWCTYSIRLQVQLRGCISAHQARNQVGRKPPRKIFRPSWKMCWAWFKTTEHGLKN